MVIKAKKQPVIKKGTTMSYEPENFQAPSNFFDTDDPQFVLDNIKHVQLISFDTETHPTELNSTDLTSALVRRWVGSGKSAKPQDFPFCISICDGTNCFTLYDSYEDGFKRIKALEPLLNDPNIEKIAHNAKDLAL